MSSRNDRFECHWRPSRGLLVVYLVVLSLAFPALWQLELPVSVRAGLTLLCAGHAAWSLPRHILLSHRAAFTALRLGPGGWHVLDRRDGWQAVRLMPDSLALPGMVILRVRPLEGPVWRRWLTRSICLPRDTMDEHTHRRLRLRLKFDRHRWATG